MQQSFAKMSQIECRISSLLESSAEMQQSSAKISILSEYKMLFRLNYCFLAQISLVIVAFLLNLHNKQTININSAHYETVFQERGSHRCGLGDVYQRQIIMGIFTFISLIGMLMSGDKPSLRDNSVMVMKLQGTINEQGQEDVMGQITGNSFNQLGLNEILSAIKKAKNLSLIHI